MVEQLELVVITGMSGAGKTVAMQSFEDMGYFCVDNMPPSLLPKFWELVKESDKISKICLVIDLRSHAFFDEIMQSIIGLENTSFITTKILFLDASDDSLVSRYKETRRTHPLAVEGRIYDGIIEERRLLQDIKVRSQKVIDTTTLSPRQLREEIIKSFSKSEEDIFTIHVMSFGFKYGIPIDADIIMDVRFLPNPHYVAELRPLTGLDQPVYEYVMTQPETKTFYNKFIDLLDFVIPGYKKEGKTSVTIAVGCTGGQHRSVALAERTGRELMSDAYNVTISHRDKDKRKEGNGRS